MFETVQENHRTGGTNISGSLAQFVHSLLRIQPPTMGIGTGLPEEHDAKVHHGQMANYHMKHRAMFCRDDVGLVIHADDTEDVKTEIPAPEYLFQKLVKTSDIFHLLIVTVRRFPRSDFLLNTGTFYFPTPDATEPGCEFIIEIFWCFLI